MRLKAKIPWYLYTSIVAAITDSWQHLLRTPNLIDDHQTPRETLKGYSKVSQWVYKDMIHNNEVLYRCVKMWTQKLGTTENISDWLVHFCQIYVHTTVIKLRNFQYRLLHNKIFCRDILKHWGKVDSNMCNLCGREKQSILHLMYYCTEVQAIWNRVRAKCRLKKIPVEFSPQNVIFNTIHDKTNHIVNTIVLIIKQYVYRCICMDRKVEYAQVLYKIQLYYRIEHENASFLTSYKKIEAKWSPVLQIFDLCFGA